MRLVGMGDRGEMVRELDRVDGVTAVRLRLLPMRREVHRLPSPRLAVAVAEGVRLAVAGLLDPEGTGRHSVVLLGKDGNNRRADTDHGHAHYLAWSSDPNSGGRVDTVVVWAPVGFDSEALEILGQVRHVRGPGLPRCGVVIEAVGEVAEVAPALVGCRGAGDGGVVPVRRWWSVTPYAPPWNVRHQPTWSDHAVAYLCRDLERASMPAAMVEPWGAGWEEFKRRRRRERPADSRRASGFLLTFEEPVTGPICLGALRHLGLGLFLPDGDGRN